MNDARKMLALGIFAIVGFSAAATNLPVVVMLPAWSNTTTATRLGASVTSTGDSLPVVTIYYGTNSAGTNAASWAYSQALGATNGTASFAATNLPVYTLHYARATASNSAGLAWSANTIIFYTLQGTPNRTVMVDTNAEVAAPTNFWPANFRFIESPVQDEAETTVDTIVPDYLADYYTQPESDYRYVLRQTYLNADSITVDQSGLSNATGFTVQQVLNSIDGLLLASGGDETNIVYNYYYTSNDIVNHNYYSENSTSFIYNTYIYTNSSTTNASDVKVAFTPREYSTVNSNVEEHLQAIDSRLAYLFYLYTSMSIVISNSAPGTVITNPVPPPPSNTLFSVTVSGPVFIHEGSSGTYTSTAIFSDGSTVNISDNSNAVWSLNTDASTITNVRGRVYVGSIVGDRLFRIVCSYTYQGTLKTDFVTRQGLDTNPPPILVQCKIIFTNYLFEGKSSQAKAFAIWSNGVTNDVTTSSAFYGSTYCSITGSLITAPQVKSNTVDVLNVIVGSISASTNFTIVNTNRTLSVVSTGNVSGGKLTVSLYDNYRFNGWPIQEKTIASYPSRSTVTTSFDLASSYTQVWVCGVIDVDSNGVVNGGFISGNVLITNATQTSCVQQYPPPYNILPWSDRTGWRPNAVFIGSNEVVTSLAITSGVANAGWTSDDVGSCSKRVVKVYYYQMGSYCSAERFYPLYWSYLGKIEITNRSYISRYDIYHGTSNELPKIGSLGSIAFELYGINTSGSQTAPKFGLTYDYDL